MRPLHRGAVPVVQAGGAWVEDRIELAAYWWLRRHPARGLATAGGPS